MADFVSDGEALPPCLAHALLHENSAREPIAAAEQGAVERVAVGLNDRKFQLAREILKVYARWQLKRLAKRKRESAFLSDRHGSCRPIRSRFPTDAISGGRGPSG